MKYTRDQKLDIGRRIYEGEISRFEAAAEYGIGSNTAREYMQLYRAEHHLPVRRCSEGVCSFRQQEYQVILELSNMFPVKLLCEMMGIQRSSFYNWKAHLSKPSDQEKALVAAIMLFKEYHLKYSSHGYHWLNAKIFWIPERRCRIRMRISAARQSV